MASANVDTMNENKETKETKTEESISFMTNFFLDMTIQEMRGFIRDNKRESIMVVWQLEFRFSRE
mgnify:CR=1 FL=1